MQIMNTLSQILLLSFAANVLSANVLSKGSSDVIVHVVKVGVNSSLTFSPSTVSAKPGEVVQFQFVAGNHSVVQSSFSSPCESVNAATNVTGFSSGFMPVNSSIPVFSVMVNDTKPIYAYCSQVGHCAKGMVVAINAPTNGTQTFKAFLSRALSSANTTTHAPKTSSTAVAAAAASTSTSAVAQAASATTSTKAPATTASGARSLVDMTLVMLLVVSGAFFIGM